jgi:outer membrane protein TolC
MLIFKEIQLGSLDYYLSRAAVSRPELKQLDDLIRIKEALMKATGADFFPAFFLGGYYSYGKAPGREHVENPFLKDDFNYNSGGGAVGMEQKLSFHMTTSRYNQSAADYRKATADRQQALMGIQLEIRKAYSDAFTKTESVKAAREGFRVGRSWVTATTLNFSVNLLPVKDLLEAFVVYSKMKVGFLNTIQDFNMALTDLSRAIGEEISDVRR